MLAEYHLKDRLKRPLRPILKFQNEVLLFLFKQHIHKYEKYYYSLTIPERVVFVKEQMQKDLLFKNVFLGMVIGHFTLDETDV